MVAVWNQVFRAPVTLAAITYFIADDDPFANALDAVLARKLAGYSAHIAKIMQKNSPGFGDDHYRGHFEVPLCIEAEDRRPITRETFASMMGSFSFMPGPESALFAEAMRTVLPVFDAYAEDGVVVLNRTLKGWHGRLRGA
mgnify:FL=1